MEKLKIAISQTGADSAAGDLIRQVCSDPAMLELCTPVKLEKEAAYRELERGKVDALVLTSAAEQEKNAIEIIVTDKANIMVLSKEPTAEDIVKFRDILERDFGLQLPRIAIVLETALQNPDLASQITEEHGINTYGPYTVEQIMADDTASHFDGIVTADRSLAQRIVAEMADVAPVLYFAGRDRIVTAVYEPAKEEVTEEGVADVSWLTHPFFVATDVIRNRVFYDEARQDPLPKLFHDKREERKRSEAPQANPNNDNTEQAS